MVFFNQVSEYTYSLATKIWNWLQNICPITKPYSLHYLYDLYSKFTGETEMYIYCEDINVTEVKASKIISEIYNCLIICFKWLNILTTQ